MGRVLWFVLLMATLAIAMESARPLPRQTREEESTDTEHEWDEAAGASAGAATTSTRAARKKAKTGKRPPADFQFDDMEGCVQAHRGRITAIAEACGLITSGGFFERFGAHHCGIMAQIQVIAPVPVIYVFFDAFARVPAGHKNYYTIVRCRTIASTDFVDANNRVFSLGTAPFRYEFRLTHEPIPVKVRRTGQLTYEDMREMALRYEIINVVYKVANKNCQTFSWYMLRKIGQVAEGSDRGRIQSKWELLQNFARRLCGRRPPVELHRRVVVGGPATLSDTSDTERAFDTPRLSPRELRHVGAISGAFPLVSVPPVAPDTDRTVTSVVGGPTDDHKKHTVRMIEGASSRLEERDASVEGGAVNRKGHHHNKRHR